MHVTTPQGRDLDLYLAELDAAAEIEYRVGIHAEDAEDAALALAEIELFTGRERPRLLGEDDGVPLPARGYSFRAETNRAALQIAVLPAGGGQFSAVVTARYAYALAGLGEGPEDGDYYPDAAAALARAVELSYQHRERVYEVYSLDGGERAALVLDGTVYRP